MDKLNPIKPEKLVKILKKLGYEEIRQRGSHKIFRNIDGKMTVIPFHKGETIGRGLLLKILKNIGISREEFLKLL
ncbi:MAG: type II toxin-antitoxin system HicA family toxin [Promethearchaeota archaeon]